MAGNLLQVGSDGKLRIKSNGIVVAGSGDACCCAATVVGYAQARSCVDGELVDLWFAMPDLFHITTTGGSRTMPYHFFIGSNHYYVLGGDSVSPTPGTMASGYTAESSCPSGTCSSCTGSSNNEPSIVHVGISGWSMCPDYRYQLASGDLNGSWKNIPHPGTFHDTPCTYSRTYPGVFTVNDTTGGTSFTGDLFLEHYRSGGFTYVRAGCYNGATFVFFMFWVAVADSSYGANCLTTSISISTNQLGACDGFGTYASNSGTAAVTHD